MGREAGMSRTLFANHFDRTADCSCQMFLGKTSTLVSRNIYLEGFWRTVMKR